MYWQPRAVRSRPTVEGPLMVNAFVSLHKMLPNFSYQFRCPLRRVPKWNLMIAGGLAPRSRRFPFLRITWTNLQRFTNRWETHTTDEGNCYFEWLEQSVVLAGFIPRDTDILGANFPDTCTTLHIFCHFKHTLSKYSKLETYNLYVTLGNYSGRL